MRATQKMRAFGLEDLAVKTGHSLSVLYRWMKAIEDGSGIRDGNKRKLISATAGTKHAIVWADFEPGQAVAA